MMYKLLHVLEEVWPDRSASALFDHLGLFIVLLVVYIMF